MEARFWQAIQAGDLETLRASLDESPELVDARSGHGLSPVRMAMYARQDQAAQLLVQRGAHLDVFDASAVGDVERARALLEEDPGRARAFSEDGFQPLGLASYFGHLEVVELLLDLGAPVNVAARNDMSVTPLGSAVANRRLEVADRLLAHGAEVNARQSGGYTPLHGAAENGHAAMVNLLLAHGADAALRSDDGRTPADLALERGHEPVAARLKDR